MRRPIQWLNHQKLELIPTTTSTEIHLAAGEVWSSEAAPGSQIACKQGIVWLTQFNDPHDHLLHPAQRLIVTRHGKVVVEALTAATILGHNN
jgi:hypothetical protein